MGELDSEAAGPLAAEFARVLAEGETQELALDMRQTSFIDSAGMRALIHVERDARARGVPLVVEPPPEKVTELLRLTGVAGRLGVGPVQGRDGAEDFTERVEVSLTRGLNAPAEARREVREAAGDLGETERGVAALLTSELVTNAVVHPESAGGELRLLITTAPGRLRVEVRDPGGGFDPERPQRRNPDQGGRGLMLVDQLASRWGAGPVRAEATDAPGSPLVFCVWFELESTV